MSVHSCDTAYKMLYLKNGAFYPIFMPISPFYSPHFPFFFTLIYFFSSGQTRLKKVFNIIYTPDFSVLPRPRVRDGGRVPKS